MGSVSMPIHGVTVRRFVVFTGSSINGINKIPTDDIVHIPISVIVQTIVANLSRVVPYVGFKIFVCVIYPGINNSNDYIGISFLDIPGS